MESIEIIVAALVGGATAGLKDTAEQSVKDAYTSLKALIKRKYSVVDIDILESNPESKSRQDVIQEDLVRSKAVEDEELLKLSRVLLAIIQELNPETLGKIKIYIGSADVSRSFRIKDIRAEKGGEIDIHADELSVGDDLEIDGMRASGEPDPKE